DLRESDTRLLVFGSKWGIEYLSEVDTWHMDGTFKTRPLSFRQLYIIHGYRNGYMIPTVYALTSDKSGKTYEQILKTIIEQANKYNIVVEPKRAVSDFEQAIFNATGGLTSYLKVSHSTCTESSINWSRGAIGLALIPLNIVIETWANIMSEYTSDDSAATTFNDYLTDTCVDDDAIFQSFIWNIHDLIITGQPRTNNHVEDFHNRLKQHFGVHPYIYEFIEALKEENEYNHTRYTESFMQTVKRKKVHNNCDNKFKEYFKRYENGTLSGTDLAIKCGKCVNTAKLPLSL
ncbi:unnamed protein product, partial [Didymodactylos carnosus]